MDFYMQAIVFSRIFYVKFKYIIEHFSSLRFAWSSNLRWSEALLCIFVTILLCDYGLYFDDPHLNQIKRCVQIIT
jgi:hypothetical protein